MWLEQKLIDLISPDKISLSSVLMKREKDYLQLHNIWSKTQSLLKQLQGTSLSSMWLFIEVDNQFFLSYQNPTLSWYSWIIHIYHPHLYLHPLMSSRSDLRDRKGNSGKINNYWHYSSLKHTMRIQLLVT